MTAALNPARPRAAARKDLPGNFVQRIVDAASVPAPTGCRPASPFHLEPEVPFADDTSADAPRLDANFFRGGVVRFAIGGEEAFLTQREALELGSRLVAHVVAADQPEGV